MNLDVFEVWMCSQASVRKESPRRGCPSQKRCCGIFKEGERHYHCRVCDILIILVCFAVTEWCGKGSRIRPNSISLIDSPFVEDLFENPPLGFHECGVHGLKVC